MTKKIIALAALAVLLIGGALMAWLPGDETKAEKASSGTLLAADADKAPVLHGNDPAPIKRRVATTPNGPHVAGRIVDPEGSPIEGARLAAIPSTSKVGVDPQGTSVSSDVSDSSGRVFLPLGTDAPTFFLYAEAQGYAPAMAQMVRSGDEVVVTLVRATALEGIVRNRDGQAVPGAQVSLLTMIGAASRTWHTRADATGAYRIEGLPVAAASGPMGTLLGCWLRATADGYAPSTAMHWVTAGAGETQTKDVHLLRGVLVRGQVVFADTHLPVADAQVVLTPSGRSRSHMLVFGHEVEVPFETAPLARTRADSKGRFTFEHAPSSQGNRNPMGDPVVYAWGPKTCLGATSIAKAEDEGELKISVEVHPAAIVIGRLVDKAGAAAADARVWVSTTGLRAAHGRPRNEKTPRSSGQTDADGRFRLTGVSARTGKKTPAAFASGGRAHFGASYQKVIERDIEVEGGVTLDLGTLLYEGPSLSQKDEGRTSRIRVVDAGGRPIWGAAVGHTYENLILRTDREGRTAITWAGSGTTPDPPPVLMLVRASGFATQHVHVPIGGAEQVVEISRKTATLRGTVVGPSGEPIAGASLEAAPQSVSAAEAFPAQENSFIVQNSRFVVGVGMTDREGRFAIGDLVPGSYRIRAQKPVTGETGLEAHAVIVSELETSQEDIEILLPVARPGQGVRLDVRIVDAQFQRGVLGATASLRSGSRTLYGAGDGPGHRLFTDVPPGEASLTVNALGYLPDQRSITVGTSGPQTIEVVLVSGAGLKGRADLPVPKEKRAMYWIWLLATTGEQRMGPAYRVTIESDGTFATQGLEAGRYYVVARRRAPKEGTPLGLVPHNPFVDVPEHGTIDRTFVFEAGGMLKVQPSDKRLPPAPWESKTTTAEQSRFGEQSWILLKDDAGNDVMRHEGLALGYAGALANLALLPGRYTLHVHLGEDDQREIPVTIEVGTEKVVSP